MFQKSEVFPKKKMNETAGTLLQLYLNYVINE